MVAVDGPSGSGKGTIARQVAELLGWHFLDSGALYRLVGLAALAAEIDFNDSDTLANIALGLKVRFANKGGDERIWLQDREISAELRSEAAGAAASRS